MGEIIQFPFDKISKKKNSGEESKLDVAGASQEVIQINPESTGRIEQSVDEQLLQETINLIPSIQIFIGQLKGRTSKESLAVRKDIVDQYSDPQVMEAIVNSSESDWKARPSFYLALLDRFEESEAYAKRLRDVSGYMREQMEMMDSLANRSPDPEEGKDKPKKS